MAGIIQIETIGASDGRLDAVRELWAAYWQSQGFAPEFQGFEVERLGLPGLYAAPRGRLLLAEVDGVAAGTAALRACGERACEAKRLFVRPEHRGLGVAKALLVRLVDEARAAGYATMYGDTMASMASALRLYEQLGFREVGPYAAHPTPGAIYLKLEL